MGEFKVKRLQREAEIGLESSKTISGTVAIGRQEHAYMETHAAVVIPLGEKDEFVCYYTTQEPTTVQVNMAKVLGVPRHKIIVKTKRVGGAFGGKERLITSLVRFSTKLIRLVRLGLTAFCKAICPSFLFRKIVPLLYFIIAVESKYIKIFSHPESYLHKNVLYYVSSAPH